MFYSYLPLYLKYWALSFSNINYTACNGICPTGTSSLSRLPDTILQEPPFYKPCTTGLSRISQLLDPVLQLHPQYHKYRTLSYSYLPYITRTGPFPTITSPISQILDPDLYHKYWSCSTAISTLSQVLVPFRPLLPLYHKYWFLSYRYVHYITRSYRYIPYITSTLILHYITSAGPCPIVTSTISHVMIPVSPVHPLFQEYRTLPYRYLPYITNTGPCATDICHIPQSLDPVLQLHHLYPMYKTLSYT